MGTVWVKEFTGGLDSRRLPETTAGGVLLKANDGHITRGGEFEKRAAFDPSYNLPVGLTVGLAYVQTGLVVFGSGAAPGGMPAGVSYQRLQHPDGVTALARVPSWTLYQGLIYAVAEYVDGSRYHFYNGALVTDWKDGRARASFNVTGGVATPTASTIWISVDGVHITTAAVAWSTTNTQTATLIADAINTAVTVPDYTATAVGTRVNILAAVPGVGANGRAVTFAYANGFTTDVMSDPLPLAGGQDAGDTFQPGSFVQTYGTRIISVSGPLTYGSGLSQPTKWNTDTVGAFFIDMSSNSSGAEELKAVAKYQSYEAIFSERAVQIWFFDSDPTNNRESQELSNTGTASPRSVTQFGDSDLFYLDESGIRSLRARDSSNAAATADIGVPIDTLVTQKLQTLTEADRDQIIGLIEPMNGRFWLCVLDVIYVFSFFPGAKVSAWSTYTPGFTISDATVFRRRVYVRSDDTIYCYSGIGPDLVYDDTVAEAWLPFFDAAKPTMKKHLNGVDIAARGNWETFVAPDPLNPALEERVGQLVNTTYDDGTVPARGSATHFSLRFRTQGTGPATLGSCVVHYDGDDNED